MENVYNPKNFHATEPLELKEYFRSFQEACNLQKKPENEAEEIQRILKEDLGLSLAMNELDKLKEVCTIDKLKLTQENDKLPIDNIPKDNRIPHVHPLVSSSLCVAKCKEDFNAMKNNLILDLGTQEMFLEYKKNISDLPNDIAPGSTFVYNVSVYAPFHFIGTKVLRPDQLRLQYEIKMLGTNTLLELANSFSCVADVFVIKEVENTKVDIGSFENAKEKYPSRCLFIENTFYNDMSKPNSIDYSEVVRKWANENQIGNFASRSIEGVTLDSLKPRLGFGYVYIHQGDCEHVFIFSDARLIQNSDCLVSKRYPRIVTMKRQANNLCFICSERHATWMVTNSDRLPIRKAFFCTTCCDSYMFEPDGRKIGVFQLFPYFNLGHMEGAQTEDAAAQEDQEDCEEVLIIEDEDF